MDPVSTFIAALQIGSGILKIGNTISGALKREAPDVALKLGRSLGRLEISAVDARQLLRRVKSAGGTNPSMINEVERLLRRMLKELDVLVRIILQLFSKPTLLERILVRLRIKARE